MEAVRAISSKRWITIDLQLFWGLRYGLGTTSWSFFSPSIKPEKSLCLSDRETFDPEFPKWQSLRIFEGFYSYFCCWEDAVEIWILHVGQFDYLFRFWTKLLAPLFWVVGLRKLTFTCGDNSPYSNFSAFFRKLGVQFKGGRLENFIRGCLLRLLLFLW